MDSSRCRASAKRMMGRVDRFVGSMIPSPLHVLLLGVALPLALGVQQYGLSATHEFAHASVARVVGGRFDGILLASYAPMMSRSAMTGCVSLTAFPSARHGIITWKRSCAASLGSFPPAWGNDVHASPYRCSPWFPCWEPQYALGLAERELHPRCDHSGD